MAAPGIRSKTRDPRPHTRLAGMLKIIFRDPMSLLTPAQRGQLLANQLEASRPAYSVLLLMGSALLVLLAGLEVMGWVPGIGYPPALTALGALGLSSFSVATLRVQNNGVLAATLLVYGGGLASLMSLPLDPDTIPPEFRTALFDLFPVAALALTVRRTAVLMIVGLLAIVAVLRIAVYPNPESGLAIYWLVIAFSAALGLLLRRYRFAFAVQSLLAHEALQAQARTDTLTGLLNRNGWNRQAARMFQYHRNRDRPLCAVFFDIDHFKLVNDTHGHAVGDRILVQLATAIRQHLPDGAVAARFGGEEFVVLLPAAELPTASTYAEAVRGGFANAARARGVRVSAGIARRRPSDSLSRLLRRADEGLYAAKAAGRDRVVVVE